MAAVAAGVALAIVETKLTTKVYEAQTTLQVSTGAASTTGVASPSDVQLADQNLASTYATLITDPGVLSDIRGKIENGRHSASFLSSSLSAKAVTGTSLISLTAKGPSPDAARTLVGQLANAFVASVQSRAAQTTTTLQNQIQHQIAQLTQQIGRVRRVNGSKDEIGSLTAARTELVRQLAAITASEIAAGTSLQVTAPPTGSSAPVSPRPTLNLIAGILVGLLVGVGLSWLRNFLDRGLHSASEAEALLGAPTLATIPVRRRYSTEDPVLGEAFDMLRANLAFLSYGQELRVLTLSSYNPREGKSSIVLGLAHAAVRGGLNAVMVDADVRTQSLSERLGARDMPGLTTAIIGMADPTDVVVEIAPGLSLVPAGPIPPNPPSLLSSEPMAGLIAQLRAQYALVLIDSPPVAHLADASILASLSDGVVIASRVGVTKRSDLPGVVAALRQVPTPIIGSVVLDQKQIDETYYPAVSKGLRAPDLPPTHADTPAETF